MRKRLRIVRRPTLEVVVHLDGGDIVVSLPGGRTVEVPRPRTELPFW